MPFQSTLPVWGATPSSLPRCPGWRISIHAPRVGSDSALAYPHKQHQHISIHAPRVGSDTVAHKFSLVHIISILAPRVGSDKCFSIDIKIKTNFNPRSPCGERPTICALQKHPQLFQSTLPVWGATNFIKLLVVHSVISIHAPRVGSDRFYHRCCIY